MSAEIIRRITEALNNPFDYDANSQTQKTTIIRLVELLPDLTRDEIVKTLVDMKVDVLDSATGAIEIPGKYFID